MPRDFYAERGIDPKNPIGTSKGRDFYAERGINPKSENKILGENIQSRHPMIANLLGKLADTSFGRGVQTAGQSVKPINEFMESSGIPEFAGAGLSHAMNIPISILNTPSYIGEKITGQKLPQLPYSHLNETFRPGYEKKLAGDIGSRAGGLFGDVFGGAGAYNLLSKGSKALNAMNPRNIGLFENALKGAAAGYSMMGEGNNREFGAALGAGIPYAVKPLEMAWPYVRAFLPGGLGKNAGEVYKAKRGPFTQEYNQKLNEFEKSGASKTFKEPFFDKEADMVLKRMDPNNQEYFKEFLANPTLEGAHYAKSEIKALQRSLEKKALKKGGSWGSRDKKAFEASKKIEEEILNSMNDAFNTSSNPYLAEGYADLGNRFGKEMGAFRDVPAFEAYASGHIKPGTLSKKMFGNDKFMLSNEAGNIPGLRTREMLDKFPILGKLTRGY